VVEVHSKLRKKICYEKDIMTLEVELIILLCGFMGSGKSFLMETLHSNSEGRGSFYDLDDAVLDDFGKGEKTLGEFIEKKGWEFFREKEFDCLKGFLSQAVGQSDYLVLSLGGGSLNHRSLSLIKSIDTSVLIWLESSFEKCFERISKEGAEKRPLLKKGKDFIYKLYLERKSLYEKSHLSVSTDDLEKIKSLDDLIQFIHEKRRVM